MNHLSPSSFGNRTLFSVPWGEAVCRILYAGIQAVDPFQSVSRNLILSGANLQVAGEEYSLGQQGRVFLLAVGKASIPMSQAVVERLGERLYAGLVITKAGYNPGNQLPPNLNLVYAEHPIPGEGSLEAGKLAASLAAQLEKGDLLLCLISGGGSSLCVAPAPPIELLDLQKINAALLASGADITEINTVRKHLETLKGGGLARLAARGRLASLILSDVIGDPVEAIAAGLTAADPTTFTKALAVLERYQIPEKEHAQVYRRLRAGKLGKIDETPKPGQALFTNVRNSVVGNNLLAARGAIRQAEEEGFKTHLLTSSLHGEARTAGEFLTTVAHKLLVTGQPVPAPACLVAGGETTVTLTGDGLGGRNLEMALASVDKLSGLKGIALLTLATDGEDGPTDAAGAIVTGETLGRAHQLGMEPATYLNRNDSYHFFEALGDLVRPGPTLTNVNDLSFVFVF